jgi:hypothetical protein
MLRSISRRASSSRPLSQAANASIESNHQSAP